MYVPILKISKVLTEPLSNAKFRLADKPLPTEIVIHPEALDGVPGIFLEIEFHSVLNVRHVDCDVVVPVCT